MPQTVRPRGIVKTGWMGGTVLVMLGCGDGRPGGVAFGTAEMEPISGPPEIGMPAPPDRVAMADMQELALETASPQLPTPEPPTDRLIRNGNMSVEVEDLDEAVVALERVVSQAGGYVARSDLRTHGGGLRSGSFMIRVPSAGFADLMSEIESVGRPLSLSSGVVDVGREYVDLETRLAVGEETVERLRALGARGGDLTDLLAVEREVGRALAELESLKGQLRYYDQRISESELNVTLTEPAPAVSGGVFRPVREALRNASRVFVESVAALIYVCASALPWLIVAALVALGLRRLWRRRRTA